MTIATFPRRLATTNPKKKAEWEAICASLGQPITFELLGEKVEFVELESIEPRDVIITKALHARRKLGFPVLVENAFFQIQALNGFPGPLYKSAKDTIGNDGLCTLMASHRNRRVRGGVSIGFTDEAGDNVFFVAGTLEGIIPFNPKGPQDFGWDCLLEPHGHNQTLAEMGTKAKNAISMRRKAIELLLRGEWQVVPASASIL